MLLGEDVVNPFYCGQDEYEEGEVLLGEDGLLDELGILENISSCSKVSR
jgi:hypothetical protein